MLKQPQQASTRVVMNTGILYAKMLITMGITLYSTRLVLNALGASDYGIFNLIAGVIAMLSFLNAAMTVSTQRYLNFHQGTGNFEMQKKIFTNSWVLHIGIGLVVVVLLLALAPFLFDGFLNIPADRIPTAKMLYYFMSISVFFTIISVPFTASLNAHENMLWIAIVNIIESVFKLAIALSLAWFIQSERLIVYGILMAILSLISLSLYAVYCLRKYSECSVRNYQIDKLLIKEIGGFVGWNLLGSFSNVGRTQGLAIVLNVFFGTVINAAYGIANQVAGQLNFFSQTMLRALNPQIMKSEGMNDRQRMLRLSMMASKFGFFLLAFIAIPCIFEMPTILKLWLKNVPDNTVVFCNLILIGTLIMQLTVGIPSMMQSVGKIKFYTLAVGGMMFLNLPIAIAFLMIGLPAYSVLISFIFTESIIVFLRLFFAKKIADLSIKEYVYRVFIKELLPIITSIITCWIIIHFLNFNFRFLFTISVSVLVFAISIYFTGLCADEKVLVNNMLKKAFKKICYKMKMLLLIKLLHTFYYNIVVKGNRNRGSFILLFKKGYFKIHKTAKINIQKGQFFFNKPFNVLEPFPSLLEMQKNSVLDVKNGFRVCPGCHIVVAQGATLSLGSGYINRNSKIKCFDNIAIGEDVVISENCTIWDSDAHSIQNKERTKPIKIGNHVWIGTNCVILKGITIGDGAVIAAGSVVNKDIPSKVLAGGVPAKVLEENVEWEL